MGSQLKPLLAQTCVSAGLLAGLISAQFAWLGREDRIAGFLVGLIVLVIVVTFGVLFGSRKNMAPTPRPKILYAALGAVYPVALLVLLTALTGGFEASALVPTFVLSIVGTTLFIAAIPLQWPEAF